MARPTSPSPLRQSIQTETAFSPDKLLAIENIALLLDRDGRQRTGLFWAEGCRSFFSAIEHGWTIHAVVLCPKLLKSATAWDKLRRLRSGGSVPCHSVPEEQFHLLSRRSEPDGIGVICEQRWAPLIDQNLRPGDIWVAIDSIRAPGNLGTILRSCAAVGARGVMLIGGEADPFDPSSIRSSMGALFAVPLIRTSARALAGWKGRRMGKIHFVGASPGASRDYREIRYPTPLLLMMGSERRGLRERQVALCDTTVKIPMTTMVDSLNLAVATTVLLYEARR